jgi:hypothetical protein
VCCYINCLRYQKWKRKNGVEFDIRIHGEAVASSNQCEKIDATNNIRIVWSTRSESHRFSIHRWHCSCSQTSRSQIDWQQRQNQLIEENGVDLISNSDRHHCASIRLPILRSLGMHFSEVCSLDVYKSKLWMIDMEPSIHMVGSMW